jgi:peptidoglycan/LPS O-acetylase OafA/YrhL
MFSGAPIEKRKLEEMLSRVANFVKLPSGRVRTRTATLQINSAPHVVRGLDSIRFLCASWVVMDHIGDPPITAGIEKSSVLGWLINGIWNNAISGPAAVIVFFVISGFCIHYPQTGKKVIGSLPSYFARRYIRILVPLVPAIVVSVLLGIHLNLFNKTILWSLLAELIYYSLYPLLLALRQRLTSWIPLIAGAFVIALAVAATDPTAGDYPSYGSALNWLLGLPCWLAGCEVAEQIRNSSDRTSNSAIWRWRAAVWFFAFVCCALRFHSPIGYPWTLNLFGMFVAVWLVREIHHFQSVPPFRLAEWAGRWSYSLYLSHILANTIFKHVPIPNLGFFINWACQMSFVLIFAFIFALALEFPGHAFARWAGNGLGKRWS